MDLEVASRYRIVAPLGRGGAATVYCAEDMAVGRAVALKLTPMAEDPEGAIEEGARREATLAERVHHENVVEVYGHGAGDDAYWLAMERVRGRTLSAMLRDAGPGASLPFDRALDVLRQIGGALDALHARGVIHFDVKPANVVVEDRTGRAVLIDFGCARETPGTPDDAIIGGTPTYMAPEQAAGVAHLYLSPRSDVYSLAIVAFELLSGKPPFVADNVVALISAHRAGDPPRISSRRPELASADEVFVRALAKSPDARPETCAALLDALEDRLAHVVAAPESGVRLTAPAPANLRAG